MLQGKYASPVTTMKEQVPYLTITTTLQRYIHVARGTAGQLALTVLEGSMEGTRYQGKPKRQWLNNIEDWTRYKYIQLKEMSVDREQWRRKTRHQPSEEEGRLERG